MATMVCQGLQSCLETEPRKFRLKLSSPRTHFISHDHLAFIKPLFEEIRTNTATATATAPAVCDDSDDKVSPDDNGGWTFLQSLSSASTKETSDDEKPYVHPMSKRSLSSLSAKSLELCTENLGSETGSSDMLDDGDTIFNVQANPPCRSVVGEQAVSPCRQLCRARDKKTAASTTREFPPPLTTISGSSSESSIRMRSHRDGGRLVIEAERVASCRNIFKAERSNGRLRLLLTVENEGADDEADTDKKEEAMFCNEEAEGDMDGNHEKVGGEMEMEKKQRDVSGNGGGRWKGGEHESENKGLLQWETLRVATS